MPRWLTLFPWFVMVCALLFSAGIVVFGLHNAKRESDFTSQLTLEKGAALISALEGALRTGMGYHWSDEVLSDLLNKVGEQPDIVSLVITNRNGTVLMAADTKLIGTSFLSPEVLAELDRVSCRSVTYIRWIRPGRSNGMRRNCPMGCPYSKCISSFPSRRGNAAGMAAGTG